MIQQRPATTDLTRVGPMAAIVLAAGLSVGFIAGQAAPDLFGSLFGRSAVNLSATALPQNADYGVRHIGVTQSLSQADDYGIRHLTAPTLTDVDDYGTRHITTTPLTPADDYAVHRRTGPGLTTHDGQRRGRATPQGKTRIGGRPCSTSRRTVPAQSARSMTTICGSGSPWGI